MKVVVFGASPNPSRYSYLATNMLVDAGHEVVALGTRKGEIGTVSIITDWPQHVSNLDTITMYVGPAHQPEHYAYLLSLKPRRIIFNPGAENAELSALASLQGIVVEEACTLVLLRTGQF